MPIDFSKPAKTDNYDTGMLASIRAHVAALACMLEPTAAGTLTGVPAGARRFNNGNGLFEFYNGSAWAEQVVSYAKSAVSISAGTGLSGGGTLEATRTLSLANTAVAPGSYGGNNAIPNFTVDQQGRITLAGVTTPSGTWGISISGSSASCSGNAASAGLASKASTLAQFGGNGTGMTFHWAGQGGQPPWLWGGSDGVNHYVYNPSNFSVAYAASAGSVANAANRTDSAAYPILWGTTGSASQLYSCAAVTITSSTGQIGCSALLASGNITAYSDGRLKKNIQVIQHALEKVSALRGVTFERIDADDGRRYTGVIAQELQAVLPEAVVETEDGTLTVAYGNVVGLLVEAIKELRSEVAELRAAR